MKNPALKWLYTHTKRVHSKAFLTVVLNVVTSVCTVLFALMMRELIDHATARNYAGLQKYSVFVFVLTVILYCTFVWAHVVEEEITVTSMQDLRAFLISSLTRKDYAEVQKKHSGEWINLLFSDIKVIGDGVSSIIPDAAGMVSRLVFAFIALAVLEPVLSFIFLGSGLVILLGVGLFRGKLSSLHKDVQIKEDRLHAFLQEIIENILVVKVFGAEKYFDDKVSGIQDEYSASRMKRRKYRIISVNLFSFAFRMGYLAALVYGGYQLINGKVSYGTLTAVLHLVSQMQQPFFNLSGILPRVYETMASTERLMAIDRLPEDNSDEYSGEFYGIKTDHVSFAYNEDKVIDDITFEVIPNDIVALTGTSGGGKSTLFLLLLGIYRAQEGEILIRTEDGDNFPGKKTRPLFAYVPQGNSLFTGTIKENVVFNHEYDPVKLKEALKAADAFEFITALPDREETRIGERGTGLSEGQAQRIAIARAVYSDAPVLLLDESTSALDEMTEANVLRNIKALKDKTVLIVTHRPAALQICTRHLRVEDHKVSELKSPDIME